MNLEGDLGPLSLADLSTENLLQALRWLRSNYEPATVTRSLATLRGWTRWLHRRGHLASWPWQGNCWLPGCCSPAAADDTAAWRR